MENRRGTERRRTLKNAVLVLSDHQTMQCVLRNLSPGGAKLSFGAFVRLPNAFHVLVPSDRLFVPAEPAWQHGLEAGIRFTGPPIPPPSRLL